MIKKRMKEGMIKEEDNKRKEKKKYEWGDKYKKKVEGVN